MRRPRPLVGIAVMAPCVAVGCIALGEGVLLPRERVDAGPAPIVFLEGGVGGGRISDASLPATPPHSVTSVDPAHGPFTGGQHAIVRGTGFTSAVRLWFGTTEVPHADVVPVDPGRVQVTVPPGAAGTVDVATQNGDDDSTRTTLPEGYVYDPFYVDPSSGPVSGGTVVTLHGDGTTWDLTTRVLVDGSTCEVIAVRSPRGKPQELDCRTPPGTPGAKRVRVVTEGGTSDVLDAFVYGDSDNGFRGGLSGDALRGKLRVVVLNSMTGRGLGGATVVVSDDATAASVKTTDANGVVLVSSDALGPKETVTVADHCFMPVTFADVPVDTVTVYLEPLISPDCIDDGQLIGIGQGGGSARAGATIQGELVWPNGIEFRRAPWDVPFPPGAGSDADPDIRQVAYVFELARDVTREFQLPARNAGVTPADTGRIGYSFRLSTSVGNLNLYALAGVENRKVSPPLFTAYTLGLVGGVAALPAATTKDVYIRMDIPLDHALSFQVDGPTPTLRGPNRVDAKVGIRVGSLGFVTLPVGTQTSLLPATAPLSFVGLPPLVNALAGAEYVTTATAYTDASHSPPRSILGLVGTTSPNGPSKLGGFVEVPTLDVPAQGSAWNGRDLSASFAPGGPEVDLTLFDVQSGGGLSTWEVTAPRGVTSVRLPDLALLPNVANVANVANVDAISGPITITVTRAKIDGFDYGSLRYADLAPRGWDAYATDVFQTHR